MTDLRNTVELVFSCVMLLHGWAASLNCSSPTPESLFKALEENLFSKSRIRPVKNFSTPTHVNVSFTIVGILGVEEQTQALTTFLWQMLEWNIEGLSWDEKECGTSRVAVHRADLWAPDIRIGEFMDEDNSPPMPYVYLYNTGHVFDDKPVRVVSSCRMEIYAFPFDVQNCTLTFGSYLHDDADVRVFQGASAKQILEGSLAVMRTSGEWKLIDVLAEPTLLLLPFGNWTLATYHVVLKRDPIRYIVNLIIPSCFLTAVDLFSFLLPPQHVDRSSFKMTLILGYTVFLLIMNDLLPSTGDDTPLINVFFSLSLAMMVASLLETVFITNIQYSSSHLPAVPHWLRVLVLQYLARVVCVPTAPQNNRVTVFINPDTQVTANSKDVQHGPVANGEPRIYITAASRKTGLDTLRSFMKTPPAVDSLKTPPAVDPLKTPPSVDPLKPPPAEHTLPPAMDELLRLASDLRAIRMQMDKYFQSSNSSHEWHRIGLVVDRLLFGLYVVFIITSFIVIIILWSNQGGHHERH